MFKIIIWENKENYSFKEIKNFSLEDFEQSFKSKVIITEDNIISYYWDWQVIRIKTSEDDYGIWKNLHHSETKDFFQSFIMEK